MSKKDSQPAVIEDEDFSRGLLPYGRKYDFSAMQIGQGMFCPSLQSAKSVIASASYYRKKNPGFRLSRRRVHGGYKVWRVA